MQDRFGGKAEKRKTQKAPRSVSSGSLRWVVFLVSLCFFLSGIAGLGYEVLWVRLFDKMIGSAPFAVATAISVIMAGMGLGSWLVGRFVKPSAGSSALLSLYGKLDSASAFGPCWFPWGSRRKALSFGRHTTM
jgi:predicted MFS family arabinose efflux permease